MSAVIKGRQIRLGSTRYMEELGVNMAGLTGAAAQMQQEGRTVSWLADVTDAPEVMGLLAFGDTVKPSSQQAIAQLHALGIQTVLVTGDNKGSASAVASALGIDQVRADVLPEGKADIVTASTTRPLWLRRMWELPCPRAPTWPCMLRGSR
jgi:Cu+-exporting ATPase